MERVLGTSLYAQEMNINDDLLLICLFSGDSSIVWYCKIRSLSPSLLAVSLYLSTAEYQEGAEFIGLGWSPFIGFQGCIMHLRSHSAWCEEGTV